MCVKIAIQIHVSAVRVNKPNSDFIQLHDKEKLTDVKEILFKSETVFKNIRSFTFHIIM